MLEVCSNVALTPTKVRTRSNLMARLNTIRSIQSAVAHLCFDYIHRLSMADIFINKPPILEILSLQPLAPLVRVSHLSWGQAAVVLSHWVHSSEVDAFYDPELISRCICSHRSDCTLSPNQYSPHQNRVKVTI